MAAKREAQPCQPGKHGPRPYHCPSCKSSGPFTAGERTRTSCGPALIMTCSCGRSWKCSSPTVLKQYAPDLMAVR